MKYRDLVNVFGIEDTNKLLENGSRNVIYDRKGTPRMTKPVTAFSLSNDEDGNGPKMLVDGVFEKHENGKPIGTYVVSMIENSTGIIQKQDMPFDTFKKMLDIGMIEKLDNFNGELVQHHALGELTASDVFTPDQVNQLLINGFYDNQCLSVGKENNVEPVTALRNTELSEDTILVTSLSYLSGEPTLTCLYEDMSDDEGVDILITDIPVSSVYNLIKEGKLAVNKNFKPAAPILFYKEASLEKGYVVSNPKDVINFKKSLSKEAIHHIEKDSFNPEKDDIKTLHIDQAKRKRKPSNEYDV